MLLLFALIAGSSSVWATAYTGTFNKITSANDFTTGYYVITGSGVAKALGTEVNSNKRMPGQAVTITSDAITNPDEAVVWYVTRSTNTCTFQNVSNSKYLSQVSTTSGKGMGFSNSSVNIAFTEYNSGFAFTLNGESNNIFKYNTGSDWFANYTGDYTASMTRVDMYKLEEATGAATTVTINSTGITNTNKFYGTAAGTLTAAVTVTATSAAVDGATVTWSSSNTSVATVGETDGVVTLVGEGSTNITATYTGKTGVYKPSSEKYILNVTNENPNAVTLWSEDFSSYSADDVPTGGTYGYVCADNGTNKTKIYEANMAGGTSPELLVGKSSGSFSATIPLENIVGDMKLKFKSNVYAVTVSTSTEGISISGDATFNAAGEHTVTFTGVTTAMTSVVITFAAGSSNVRIDDIVLKGSKVVPVTIASSGYSTLASAYGLDFSAATPAGLEAYVASAISASAVTLTQVTEAPASTGVILKGTAGTEYTIPVKAAAAAVGTNYLHAAVTAYACAADEVYILQNGKFCKVTAASTVPAGKAYLLASDVPASAPDFLGFSFDGTTSISEELRMKSEEFATAPVYNLAGQRVANPTKGLYIVNGKKVILK